MMQAAQLERCFTHGQPLTPKRDAKSSHFGGMMWVWMSIARAAFAKA
jgi:hypothetical protein